jgi:purine-binding chemotaxis protein CheW
MSNHLLFSLNSIRYCVDASAALEILWLPELVLVEEAPSYVTGCLNLHGHILPIMSLECRFQRLQKPVKVTDQIIVLEFNGIRIGIMVSEVHDVVDISPADIEPMPRYHQHADTAQHFVDGEAKVNGNVWMVLNLVELIEAPALVHDVHEILTATDCFQQLPAADREVFHARAVDLATAEDIRTETDQESFVVIQLGDERFAVAMTEVREFCHLRQVTPVPCCPAHIMGNMNLRGDILTLVDVRPVLTLNQNDEPAEVMVVESEGLRVGVPVSKVLDVISVRLSGHLPLPAYVGEAALDYCTSAIPYADHVASVLNINALLGKGLLEVNEHV